MNRPIDYSLYLIVDRPTMHGSLADTVRKAVQGGCTVVQLRDKQAESSELYVMALALKELTGELGVPLIINDRADIAVAVDAAGVHLGPDDVPAREVRKIIGNSRLLGVSASSFEDAAAAEKDGADYLSVGAMFPTQTKPEAKTISFADLNRICSSAHIPVLAVGGINEKNMQRFSGTGACGVCVASAVVQSSDAGKSAAQLRLLLGQIGL